MKGLLKSCTSGLFLYQGQSFKNKLGISKKLFQEIPYVLVLNQV